MTREQYLPFGRPNFGQEEIDAITRVLQSGWVGMGPETVAFEKELSAAVGAPHVITVSSCTAALHLSLQVHGVGPGDEVVVPSLTWCSTANAALYLGARVKFCDVDPETFCATPESIAAQVTPKTKAVVVVHFGGLAADIEMIRAALPPHVAIVEDAAHALGARYKDGRPVGASGNLVCYSFYANKNLSTAEGGAVALFDQEKSERLKSLRQHALPADAWKRFIDSRTLITKPLSELGYKANYTDLQASIGRVQLRRQPELDAIRQKVARGYYERLHETVKGLKFQAHCLDAAHARHLFVVQLPLEQLKMSRNEILMELRDRKIGASVHYAPLHPMPLYTQFGEQALPVTEHVCERNLTLPISSSMKDDDVEYVCENFIEVLKLNRR